MTQASVFTEGEILRYREDTPGASEVTHLNNAGAGLMPNPVRDSIIGHLHRESLHGGYEAADQIAPQLDAVYASVAKLLGADARQVALVENSTVAYATALSSVAWKEGDTILTSLCDYVSNQLMFIALEKRFGIRLLHAPDLPQGGVDPDAVEQLVRKHGPKLVAITHMPTNSGLIQDVETVGEICRSRNCLYLVDACQSAGQLPLDIERIGCDFLTASCRKFLRGPRGTGFLFVSDRVLEAGTEPLFIDLRGAEWTSEHGYEIAASARRFENFESSIANLLGVGAAVDYALDVGLDRIHARTAHLARECRSRVADIEGIRVLDQGEQQGAIVTLALDRRDVAEVVTELRRRRINVSRSPKFFGLLDYERKHVKDAALRVSPHYYNTLEEIEAFASNFREILNSMN